MPAESQPDAVRWPLLSRTERRNDRTTDIDTVGTLELLRLLNAEDAMVALAVTDHADKVRATRSAGVCSSR